MGLTVLFVGFGAVAKCCASIWPSMVKKIKKIKEIADNCQAFSIIIYLKYV